MLCGNRARSPLDSLNVRDIGVQADSLYFALLPALALALCEEAIASGEDDAGLRWRAARAAIAVGMMTPEGKDRKAFYDRALRHAHRAAQLAPTDLGARYWVAAAAGRRTHRDDPLLSARLGREAFDQVTVILAADSMHAGAHHVLGMVHAEVLRVPRVVRFIASRALRVDLAGRANWSEAERHLKRAVELDPEMVQYLADLGALYARAGKIAEMNAVAARLALVPSRHPMDDSLRSIFVAKWKMASSGAGL